MPRALVTGASGFVGANLVEGLSARGWQVRALVRRTSSRLALAGLEYEEALGDVLDRASLDRAMAGVDCVFHAAAVSDYWRRGIEQLYRVNVEGTRNVMAAARDAHVARAVHTSSVGALGVPERGRPADESHAFNLPPERFHYGHSKLLAEQVVRAALGAGLAAVIVNPTVILGPRDVHLISGSIIREAARGRLAAVPPGGLNIVHVADVVAGQIAAAERGVTGERYILAGEDLTHWQLAEMVCRAVGVHGPRLLLPRAALGPLALGARLVERTLGPRLPISSEQLGLAGEYLYFDGTKARRAFGLASTPARVAVEDTRRWYRDNGLL